MEETEAWADEHRVAVLSVQPFVHVYIIEEIEASDNEHRVAAFCLYNHLSMYIS